MTPRHSYRNVPQHTVHPAGRRRPLWVVIIVASSTLVFVVVSIVKGPGVPATRHPVSLLPHPDPGRQRWTWTVGCYLEPDTAAGCGTSDPNLGYAQLDGNIWNLGAANARSGGVEMSLGTSGSMRIRGKLSEAPPCTAPNCITTVANTWVRGYPSVLYGLDLCQTGVSPTTSRALPLPMQVSSIPSDLIGTTTYSSQAQQVTYDVAYDMWLSDSNTTAPCHTEGTVEVMVWTDYDSRALLPGAMEVQSATVPFADGRRQIRGTNAWSVYANNVFPNGRTAPWGGTIWFVLDQHDRVSAGTVSVDLSAMLRSSAQLLEQRYGWEDFTKRYWLDTVPFGIEFGPHDAAPASTGPADFSFQISSYCLASRTTLSSPGC